MTQGTLSGSFRWHIRPTNVHILATFTNKNTSMRNKQKRVNVNFFAAIPPRGFSLKERFHFYCKSGSLAQLNKAQTKVIY